MNNRGKICIILQDGSKALLYLSRQYDTNGTGSNVFAPTAVFRSYSKTPVGMESMIISAAVDGVKCAEAVLRDEH